MHRARRSLLLLLLVLTSLALPVGVLLHHFGRREADFKQPPLTVQAAVAARRLGVAKDWAKSVITRWAEQEAERIVREENERDNGPGAPRGAAPLAPGEPWDSAADDPRWQHLCPTPPQSRPNG
jgi:hypothetical protein